MPGSHKSKKQRTTKSLPTLYNHQKPIRGVATNLSWVATPPVYAPLSRQIKRLYGTYTQPIIPAHKPASLPPWTRSSAIRHKDSGVRPKQAHPAYYETFTIILPPYTRYRLYAIHTRRGQAALCG